MKTLPLLLLLASNAHAWESTKIGLQENGILLSHHMHKDGYPVYCVEGGGPALCYSDFIVAKNVADYRSRAQSQAVETFNPEASLPKNARRLIKTAGYANACNWSLSNVNHTISSYLLQSPRASGIAWAEGEALARQYGCNGSDQLVGSEFARWK